MQKVRHIASSFASGVYKQGGRIIKILLITLFLSLIPAPNKYLIPIPQTGGLIKAAEILLPSPPLFPINRSGTLAPYVSAQGVVIKDISSGVDLFDKNAKTRFSPASTTKIMTAVVAMDTYKLDDVLTVATVVNSGRVMGLVSAEKITVESLLYGSLVHSANDAAYALAENYPGGINAFVTAMNQKTREYRLNDTNFTNPIGFDDEAQYTTPQDLAKLAIIALSDKTFAKIVGTRAITVSDVNFTYFHELTNVNELLGKVAGVAGVKTGYTEFGGEILVSEVRKMATL